MTLRDITSVLFSFDRYTLLNLFQNMTDDEDMSPELLLWRFCHTSYYNNSGINKLVKPHAASNLGQHMFFDLADVIAHARE